MLPVAVGLDAELQPSTVQLMTRDPDGSGGGDQLVAAARSARELAGQPSRGLLASGSGNLPRRLGAAPDGGTEVGKQPGRATVSQHLAPGTDRLRQLPRWAIHRLSKHPNNVHAGRWRRRCQICRGTLVRCYR